MKITCEYRGQRTVFEFAEQEIVIGRSGAGGAALKLDFDARVSRRHARIWWSQDRFWICDLESASGTQVNGAVISGDRALNDVDRVQVGETVLQVEELGRTAANIPVRPIIDESSMAASENAFEKTDGEVEIYDRRNSTMPSTIQLPGSGAESQERLQMLYDLPLEFSKAPDPEALYEKILHGVVNIIPGAIRGALLILDRLTNKLILRASVPADRPPISRTLVRRAASEGHGFIWSRSGDMDPTKSIASIGMQTGMYAPLMWQEEVLGVMCLDNPHRSVAFNMDDLDFLIAVTHYAAAAVSNQILQHDLRHYIEIQKRLLTNFSEKLRSKIVDQARSGRLKPGGEKSNVTLLMSDLRGFTKTSAGMSTDQVVEMLNEYFSAVTEVIFRHGGTVDKFIGDGVLAVWGSPEHDDQQNERALRAAIEMQDAMKRVNQERSSRHVRVCECGIGLHRGEVLHGFIGSESRLEFTVIGDAVNKTSRISDGAGPGEILVSRAMHDVVRDKFEFSKVEIETKHEGKFAVWRLGQPKNPLVTRKDNH